MWIATSQNRTELSAAFTLKGKEAQTPCNKAFESGKTNTTNIPMLDIIRPAHTVGITNVRPPIGRREAFSISNWLFFFLQLKLELSVSTVWVCCACVARRRLRHVHVDMVWGLRMFYWISLFVPIRISNSELDLFSYCV